MKYLSRRYGVYRVANEQYMPSTMTAGIRHPDHRARTSKRKRITMAVINKSCRRYYALRRYRALFFISVAAFSAAQGFMVLMFLSTFLLVASLLQRKKALDNSSTVVVSGS